MRYAIGMSREKGCSDMRLIDAEAEIERIEKEIEGITAKIDEWERNRKDREGYHDVDAEIAQYRANITDCKAEIASLRNYQTVDAVEAVRCRDCEYAHINRFAKESRMVHCIFHGMSKQQDDFCSYGERRDGD